VWTFTPSAGSKRHTLDYSAISRPPVIAYIETVTPDRRVNKRTVKHKDLIVDRIQSTSS